MVVCGVLTVRSDQLRQTEDDRLILQVNLDHSLLLVLKEVQFISDPNSVPATVRALIDQVSIV